MHEFFFLDFVLIFISGRKIIKDLASVSDVLVENYLPGKLDSWGLGFSDLSKVFSFVFLSLCLTKKLNNVNTVVPNLFLAVEHFRLKKSLRNTFNPK
jgi:hypothetical protein